MAVELKKEDRSLGDLFSDLTREISLLFRQEAELAKLEMSRKMSRMTKHLVLLGVGAAIAYAGFLGLVAAAVLALGLVVSLWLSALIVGLVIAIIGYALLQTGISRLKRQNLVPEQTIDTLKEDKEWLREIK